MSEGDQILWQILLQLLLILLNAVFACAEIAIISINDSKLERMSANGNKGATRLLTLTKQPAKFLATIQVGITLAGFLGSAFAAGNFSAILVDFLLAIGVNLPISTLELISVILITFILSYFTLVFGELVPKRIAMQKAEAIGLAMSGLIITVAKLFKPIVGLLTISTNTLLKLLGIDPFASDENVTEEEIRMMIDVGMERGTINEDEKEIIHNVFEFNDKTAVEIMTHRTDVILLWLEENDKTWAKTIAEGRHSHYPVCDQGADDIIGILNTKDYYCMKDKSRAEVMEKAVRQPQLVPETVKNDILFQRMKHNRNHFAVVIDEYGGVSGVITMNDLLEELVGDLDDNLSLPPEPPMFEQIDNVTWSIRGIAALDDVEKKLGVKLPIDDYDTLGGMLFGLLGSIPDDGSTPELEEYGLLIKVTEIKEHRLEKAIVVVLEKNEI